MGETQWETIPHLPNFSIWRYQRQCQTMLYSPFYCNTWLITLVSFPSYTWENSSGSLYCQMAVCWLLRLPANGLGWDWLPLFFLEWTYFLRIKILVAGHSWPPHFDLARPRQLIEARRQKSPASQLSQVSQVSIAHQIPFWTCHVGVFSIAMAGVFSADQYPADVGPLRWCDAIPIRSCCGVAWTFPVGTRWATRASSHPSISWNCIIHLPSKIFLFRLLLWHFSISNLLWRKTKILHHLGWLRNPVMR